MADEINSNLTNKFNIKQLIAINNGIKGLKKADNESLFTLAAALDTDNNDEFDSNEAMISKILEQGENKINELANAVGYQDIEQENQINFDISKSTIKELFENINKNNIIEILKNYSKNDSAKTLIKKVINDHNTSIEDKKALLIKIKNAIIDKSKNLDITINLTDQEFNTIIENISDNKKTNQDIVYQLNKLFSKYLRYIEDTESMNNAIYERLLTETKDIHILQDEEEYLIKMTELMKSGADVLGDGHIYNKNGSKQRGGNCWAHAGINALVATKQGQELVDNLVTKKNGIIAVKIPEAANKNMPKPKGDGIYTFTESEVICVSNEISFGDGDVTAILLAIGKYFSSIGENSKKEINTEGNTNYRILELLTGEKNRIFLSSKIPQGVSSTTFDYKKDKEAFYNKLKELLDSNSCAITVGDTSLFEQDHALAVIKMNDDFVYLIDSNNPKNILQYTKDEFITNSKAICIYRF